MGYFSRYKQFYKEPERYTTDIARERRYSALLQKERDRISLVQSLSQARKNTVNLSRKIVNDPISLGQKAASIAAALNSFKERDFADPVKREVYRKLRAAQGGQRKVPPSGADRRQFHFDPFAFGTIYGTVARIGGAAHALAHGRTIPGFNMPWSVVPCVQRTIRREVMFALGRAGRGYHKKKRRTEASFIPC